MLFEIDYTREVETAGLDPTLAMLSRSLNRLWLQCSKLEKMGRAGAERIRTLVPEDPIQIFVDNVKSCVTF